jgi:hypothetical protein
MENDQYINRDEAKNLAYAVHQDKVESEVNRILEWIRSRAKLGSIRTKEVVIVGEAVTVFVVNRLRGMGFFVEWEYLNDEANDQYRLDITWVQFVY